MRRAAILLGVLAGVCRCGFALNPSLEISQYAHTPWNVRDGFSLGNIYDIAQTPDGYLWLGGETGLFRFDGVRSIAWQPPAGQSLPAKAINRLLGARDGTLWIGSFAGLATWSAGKLMLHPEFPHMVNSLFQDREGTVWAGSYGAGSGSPNGRVCAMRSGGAQCYGDDGAFGRTVSSMYEDNGGNLWASTYAGVWRLQPGPPTRYANSQLQLSAVTQGGDGRPMVAVYGGELLQTAGDKLERYPIRGALNSNGALRDSEVNSNKLLRDRDGGLWIGTVERGLLHVHQGRTDVFSRSDGLSGDVVLSLFEDREGSVWVSTTGGLDRFRELPVTTVSKKQGLPSDAANSVLATSDGSVWVGTHDGLARLKNGVSTLFRQASGLPDGVLQSIVEDDHGRIWAPTRNGLAYFQDGRFIAVDGVPGGDVHYIARDKAGNLWLSEDRNLLHVRNGRVVEQIPWSDLGRRQSAEVVLSDDERGGVWLGFWMDGGVLYLQDRAVRASHTVAEGLGEGAVQDLRLDRHGALWVATQNGGLSRVQDGRVATMTRRNGLPCDAIHWTMEDDTGSVWLYTACGLVRIAGSELEAWVADPKHKIETTVLDASDGVKLRAIAASAYGPRVTKATDGRIWFVTGEGVQVLDPRHLVVNTVQPPVRIEQVQADGKPYPLHGGMRLPANVRDLWIDYTALSLAAPEKVRFKYMLEGQDPDWKEVINDRQAQYSNLRPRKYRFRVIASNNSGIWNETGDSLEFSIAPALYQTNGFLALCATALLALLWVAYQLRLRRLQREFDVRIGERLEERTRIARELHDTLLQSFQGLMFSFQAARNLLPGRAEDAIGTLDEAIREGDEAIAEGRNAIQGLRGDPAADNNVEHLITAAANDLARASSAGGEGPEFRVTIEGTRQPLSPLLQDDVHRIAREILRNSFHHARASRIEAEIAYDGQFFRLRIRDNGKGIDRKVIEEGVRPGHWGLPGIRERAKRIGARFQLWSEAGAGTEAELTIPARIAYGSAQRRARLRFFPKSRAATCPPERK